VKAILVGIGLASALIAQGSVTEQPADPSLEETLRFLQRALPTNVNYIIYGHDNIVGTDTQVKRGFELNVTNVDPSRCYIAVRYRFDNGKTGHAANKTVEIELRNVEEVTMRPMQEVVQEVDDGQGHPEHRVRVDPPMFLVFIKSHEDLVMFQFDDGTTSQQVTKAFQHAMDLCSSSGYMAVQE
jgi:hypothetical protein